MRRSQSKPSPFFGIILVVACAAAGMILVDISLIEQMSLPRVLGLAFLGIILLAMASLAAWRVMPLVLAKPTMKVDYVAEFNRVSKPPGFDPCLNAGSYNRKLIAEFKLPPDVLADRCESWPSDLDPDQMHALAQWAPVNKPVLPLLKQVAQCSYWWYELKSPNGALNNVEMPDLVERRKVMWAILLLAKHDAAEGRISEGLDTLTDLYMMGVRYMTGPTLLDQLVGLAVICLSQDAFFTVLSRCNIDADVLAHYTERLALKTPGVQTIQFREGERLYGHDWIQRSFTDDGCGDGRLIPSKIYEEKKKPSPFTRRLSYLEALRISLDHPGRAETTRLFEESFAAMKILATRTPWQLHSAQTDYETELKRPLGGNYCLQDLCRATAECIRMSWQRRASQEALVATFAILAYRARHGELPRTLDELVKNGSLDRVPEDPYSGKAMVYRIVGDDFTLYGVGENFLDDGGVRATWPESRAKGDIVFWPVQGESPTTGR